MSARRQRFCGWLIVSFLFLAAGCRQGRDPVRSTGAVSDPGIRFTDVTAQSGIHFRHTNGAAGRKYMPETMGSGCAFLDYDNDGWQDLLFVNGEPWPEVRAYRSSAREPAGRRARSRHDPPTMALYRNDGAGRFYDVTAAAGLNLPLYGMGAAVGDWDNDGFDDLAITALGGVFLFHNEDGRRFDRVGPPSRGSADEAGAGQDSLPSLPGGWPTSAAWLDYNRDGRLDLFVCHYVRWTPDSDVYWSLDGVHKSYTTPEKYQGESCRLYRNEGGSRFSDVTDSTGIRSARSKALGVAVCDYDADGWPDLFVSNDTEPSLVYHNQGDGTFQEVATELGVAVAESGKPKAGMGIDTGDDRNDGNESILMTNFAGEQISLYRKDSTGLYLDNAAAAGVGLPSQLFLGFGGLFFDADLDGWLDIFVTDGHVMDDIERRNTGVSYAQPALLFHNDGHGQYADITRATGTALPAPRVGRGAACGDADNDGDLDLLLTANGGPARLLRNDTRRENGWLKLQLRGGPSNRDAIGARVQVRVGGLTMTRMVKSGSSYLSASDRRLTFGLGRSPGADSVTIQWPTGAVQALGPVERNRWLRITEGRSGTGAQVR
jgi:enediyne biosynthesis protein E4